MHLIHQFTIGTISLLAKLAICLPLHLLRCTTRSFELARDQTCACAGLNKPVEAVLDRLCPPTGVPPARTTKHTAFPAVSPRSDAAGRARWSRGDSNS